MSQYLDRLRAALGPDAEGQTDEQLLAQVAQATGESVNEVANRYQYKPSTNGKWGNRLGASVDSYQAGLYGIGEALGSKWAGKQRQANEFEAEVERQRAQKQGAIMSYHDVGGVGDAADYVGGLAVDSAPYLAEAAVGGVVARGLMSGTRAALTAARTAGNVEAAQAAAQTLRRGSVGGAVVASYPSSVGDILSNQREQNGTMDLPSAAALGVPYALLNGLEPTERMAATGMGVRGLRAMDNLQGVRGGLARAGGRAAVTGLEEGANEVGQEFMNQFGRMAVDPNETFYNDKSADRFQESFVGGAALGGLAGGSLGGWRRSEGYVPKPTIEEQPDLLQGGRTVPRDTGFRLQSYGQAEGPQYQNPDQWEPARPATPQPAPQGQPGLFSGVREMQPDGSSVELGTDELRNPGQYAPTVPGQSLVPTPAPEPTPEQSRAAEIKAQVEQRKAQLEAAKARGESYGLKGTKQIELMQQLEALQEAGKINEDEFRENIITLGAGSKFGVVQKFIDEKSGVTPPKAEKPAKATKPAAAPAAPTVREDHAPGPVTIIRPGEQASAAGQPAGVAPGTPVAPSPVAQGSTGDLGQLPANAAGRVAPAAGGAAPSVGAPVAVGVGDNGPAAAVTPAPAAPGKRTLRVVKKGSEAAKPAAKAAPASAPAVSPDEQFDNYPDFVDWALKKVGATEAQADVYKMKGGSTERGAEGIGEYAGQTHSNAAVIRKHSVSDQTVSNWVKALAPKVKELELLHLVNKKRTAEKVEEKTAEPELVADLAEGEEGNATVAEAAEDSTPQTSDDAGAGSSSLDDGFDAVEDDTSNENSGIQIRDRMGSGAEVEANNDDVANRTYKLMDGDTSEAKAKWEELAAKDKSAPAWDSLGPGQKAWFNSAVELGEDVEETFNNVAESRNEGIRLVEAQKGNDPNASEVTSPYSRLIQEEWVKTAADVGDALPSMVERAMNADPAAFVELEPNAGIREMRLVRPVIGAAATSLMSSPYASFFKAALHNVRCMFVVDPTDGTRIGDMAAWPKFGRAISVSADCLAARAATTFQEDRMHASGVTSMLAHELAHIMEFTAGVDAYRTNHHVYVYSHNGELVPSVTPVSLEAIKAYADMAGEKATEEEQHSAYLLQYALEPIMRLVDDNVMDNKALDNASYHASSELLPVLVQYFLEYPKLMAKHMPQAMAYVESILRSGYTAYPGPQVRKIIERGNSNGNEGNVRKVQGSARAVPGPVQTRAADSPLNRAGASRPAVAKLTGQGGAASANPGGQAQGGGSGGRLNQTETPEFKRWFGDSKVVDDQGKPLVVYHGTQADFSQFKQNNSTSMSPLQNALKRLGLNTAAGDFYFAADPEFASSYAGQHGQLAGGNVMPVYLSIKNPAVWTKGESSGSAAQAMKQARAEGRDGLIIRSWTEPWATRSDGALGAPTDVFVAFDVKQIKSATGNNGQFDPRSGDIRRTDGGRLPPKPPGQDLTSLPPPREGGGKGLRNWISALVEHKWRAIPGVLGALTTEQLAERFKDLPGKAGEALKTFHDAMTRMSVRASTIMAASDKLKREWDSLRGRFGKDVDDRFVRFVFDSTVSQIWANKPLSDEANKHVNIPGAAAKHASLQAQWEALPDAYKTLFNKLQSDFDSKYQAKVAALRASIISGYIAPESSTNSLSEQDLQAAALLKKPERKAFMAKYGTNKLKIDALRGLWSDLDEHAAQFPTKIDGPYFPLMRFGDHVVSLKSAKYQAAEAALAKSTAAMEEFYAGDKYKPIVDLERDLELRKKDLAKAKTEEGKQAAQERVDAIQAELDKAMAPLEKMREQLAKDQETVRKLKANPAEYQVEMYESIGDATARRKQLEGELKARGIDAEVKHQLKDKYLQSLDAVQPAFMKKLSERLTAALPDTEAAKVRTTMRELYLQMQPDRSALKAQLRRVGTAGYSQEALRSYAASSVRDAWHISRLENAGAARGAMNELRFSDDMDAKLVGNELAKRVAQNMQLNEKNWMSAATNLTYLNYLGASPAFFLTQLTQPFVISLPVMAARHGAKALSQLGSSWKDAAQIVKSSYQADKSFGFTIDPEAAAKAGIISKNEAEMLRGMLDSGRIDITITHDLGVAAEGSTNHLGKAAAISAWPAQQAEVINRVSTALAAYRLEKKAGKTSEEAAAYADQVVGETHLNYAQENRARFMHANAWGGWGKVMFQFKAYQQGMVYLIAKNMLDATRGDKEAAKAVAFLLGAQLAAAGTTGLPITAPLLAVATLIYKAMDDDDEDRNLKEMMYQGLASVLGSTGADALMKGLPAAAGVDLSGKIGLGNILNPVPFVDDRKEGRDAVAAYWIALTGGAPAGMVSNWAEALKQAGQGDWAKATATAAPKVLGDMTRGATMYYRGLVDSKGNEIVNPEDMKTEDVVAKMLGFTTTDTARLQERRSAFFEAKQNVQDARNAILRDLINARMKGETDEKAQERAQEFNSRNPEQRITTSAVLQGLQRRRQESRTMAQTGGLPVNKKTRGIAREFESDQD